LRRAEAAWTDCRRRAQRFWMFMALGLMSAAADPGHDFELGSVKIGPL
jgi:hypothetical protein